MNIRQTINELKETGKKIFQIEQELKNQNLSQQELILKRSQLCALDDKEDELISKRVDVELTEFTRELAKAWGVEEKDIQVEVKFPNIRVNNYIETSKEWAIRKFESEPMQINFSAFMRKLSLVRPFISEVKQANGKTLADNVIVKREPAYSSYDLVTLHLDNLQDFVLSTTLYNLVDLNRGKVEPKTGHRKIILNLALENERKADEQKENELG